MILIITAEHSLGAGIACLAHLKVHVKGLMVSDTNRRVLCFGFVPLATYLFIGMPPILTAKESNGPSNTPSVPLTTLTVFYT
jgi:hypothetical protein